MLTCLLIPGIFDSDGYSNNLGHEHSPSVKVYDLVVGGGLERQHCDMDNPWLVFLSHKSALVPQRDITLSISEALANDQGKTHQWC